MRKISKITRYIKSNRISIMTGWFIDVFRFDFNSPWLFIALQRLSEEFNADASFIHHCGQQHSSNNTDEITCGQYRTRQINTYNRHFVLFFCRFSTKDKGYIRPQSDEGHRKLLRSSHFEAFSTNDFERYPPLECKRPRPPNELKHCSVFFVYLLIVVF